MIYSSSCHISSWSISDSTLPRLATGVLFFSFFYLNAAKRRWGQFRSFGVLIDFHTPLVMIKLHKVSDINRLLFWKTFHDLDKWAIDLLCCICAINLAGIVCCCFFCFFPFSSLMHLPTPAHFLLSASPDIRKGTDGDCGRAGQAGGSKGDGIFPSPGAWWRICRWASCC